MRARTMMTNGMRALDAIRASDARIERRQSQNDGKNQSKRAHRARLCASHSSAQRASPSARECAAWGAKSVSKIDSDALAFPVSETRRFRTAWSALFPTIASDRCFGGDPTRLSLSQCTLSLRCKLFGRPWIGVGHFIHIGAATHLCNMNNTSAAEPAWLMKP